MYSEKIKILGRYNFQEGSYISIPMGPNMELGTEASTQVHEMYHMHLMNMTNLGLALQILEMERVLAEEKDYVQKERMGKYIEIISKKILNVQEIYANNMELLYVSEIGGIEAAKKCYDNKPKAYKNYCDVMNVITENKNLSFAEKQNLLNALCMYAMNIRISSEYFITALESDRKLIQYFDSENHPERRLKKEIELYVSGVYIDVKDSFDLDIISFINKIKERRIVKYIDDFLPELNKVYENMLNVNKNNVEHLNEVYYKNIEESIKVFDFSTIKVQRGISFVEQKPVSFFVIKNCMNLDNKNENYYVIGHQVYKNEPIYISTEATGFELVELLKNATCVVVHFYEYDIEKCCPKYFETQGKPVIVFLDDYRDCYSWLQDELEKDELYIGNLYDNQVNNFYTILFFSKRNDPNVIFVFPTTKRLAQRLINDFELTDIVLYTNQVEFLKILSCLDNELNMLKVLQWLLSFFTDSKGEFSPLFDSAAKMNFDLTRTLMDSVLKIKVKNYFEYLAALPTKKTVGKPFYALMQFDGENNTGVIRAGTDKELPIFFYSKQEASKWKSKYITTNHDISTYQVVGVDIRYWKTLKEFLLKRDGKVCICFNAENGFGEVKELNAIDKIIK